MAFDIGENNGGRNSKDRLQPDKNNPADDPTRDRVRGEEDPSKREGHLETEDQDQVGIDESETPGGMNRTADANLDE